MTHFYLFSTTVYMPDILPDPNSESEASVLSSSSQGNKASNDKVKNQSTSGVKRK